MNQLNEYEDGHIELEPCELITSLEISKKTLEPMDSSISNLKNGIASEPVDLSDFTQD